MGASANINIIFIRESLRYVLKSYLNIKREVPKFERFHEGTAHASALYNVRVSGVGHVECTGEGRLGVPDGILDDDLGAP